MFCTITRKKIPYTSRTRILTLFSNDINRDYFLGFSTSTFSYSVVSGITHFLTTNKPSLGCLSNQTYSFLPFCVSRKSRIDSICKEQIKETKFLPKQSRVSCLTWQSEEGKTKLHGSSRSDLDST